MYGSVKHLPGLRPLWRWKSYAREVRKQAIFALSRRPADEAVPALLKMVETLPDRELRKTAVFWLVQSKDPRAVAWVEKRLTR
jgi:HEAT repeat protein